MPEIAGLKISLEQQRAPLVEAVQQMASIPSVMNEGEAGTLFGVEVDRALRAALDIAARLGMNTAYGPGGAYGWAEAGQGGEMVGILGHVDVVPAGNLAEWSQAPFDPQIRDERIYGRGVQDDKGPTLAALFAFKALADAGVQFNKRLRFIFGTDEENLWRCMKAYLAAEETPTMGFAPDSKFPLIYAEKGLLQVILECNNQSGLQFQGGEAFNAVPAMIDYSGPGVDAVRTWLLDHSYAKEDTANGVRILGKAAHAQVAETGTNAICRLARALAAAGVHSNTIDFLALEAGEDPFGTHIFGDIHDEESGRLKFNVGKIELAEQEKLSIDMRLPVTASRESILDKLTRAASRYGLSVRQHDWMGPTHIPRDHFLVQTLLRIYRETTGDTTSQPEVSGGATYARAMPNCVAYGAVFPGRKKVEHQPDEHIRLDDLYLAMEIYAKAIYELTR
jgi:succinyl-diaminopimelate desuccinylase